MSWQRMQNSVEQFVPQTPYEEVLTNDALHGSAPTLPDTEQEKKVYTGGQWTIHELLVLQAAKKEQQDNAMFAGAREKHRNRSDKWAEIEDIVWRNGVKWSGKGCQTKWDSLISDYKKVKDYQKDIPSGQDSYWQMVSSNRKARKLPLNFFEEVYNAMDMWLCQRSSINPSYTVSDTSVLPSAQGHPAVEEENVEESEDNAAGYSPPSSINNGNEYSNSRKRQRTPRGSEGLISVMLKSEEAKEWWGKQEAIAMEAHKVSYEIAMEGRKMTYNIHRDNSLQRDRAIEVAATAANALVNIGSGLTYLAHTLNMSMTQGGGLAPSQFNGRHDLVSAPMNMEIQAPMLHWMKLQKNTLL